MDRLPPQNLEAEESILSACLIHADAIETSMEILSPDDFYRTAHQKIYLAIMDLHGKNEPVDLITTMGALKAAGSLDECGGAVYLAKLTNDVPMAVSVASHSGLIKDAAVKRQLIDHHTRQLSECFEPGASAGDLAEAAQSGALGIDVDSRDMGFRKISEGVDPFMDHLGIASEKGGGITGVTTGYRALDLKTSGLQPSDLVIIAGRPSMGKTAMALNIGENAEGAGNPIGIFSLEMSERQLIGRMMAKKSQINGERMKGDRFNKDEWESLHNAAEDLYMSRIYVNDRDTSLGSIRRDSRKMVKQHDVKAIIIDYLQLIRTKSKADRRDLEIGEITRSLKGLAKELDVPIILLSQLNRMLEQRADKRPVMSDLRESGAIEQDADIIIFVYRDEVYNKEEDNPNKGIAEIIMAKNRNGSVGTVRLAWVPQHIAFYDMAYEQR